MVPNNDSSKNLINFSEKEAIDELVRVHKEILLADVAYYQENNPVMHDSEYDKLVVYFETIRKTHPAAAKKTRLQKGIGGKPQLGFEKVDHKIPMLSLTNALNRLDIENFQKGIKKFLKLSVDTEIAFTSEPKIDGLSLSLRYLDGNLVQAVTRGDGYQGENVTSNIRFIRDVPKKLSEKISVLEVRGEVYMSRNNFSRLNQAQIEKGLKIFANPRNAAAGTLRQLKVEEGSDRRLNFFAYSWGETSNLLGQGQFEAVNKLAELGFKTNELTQKCETIDELISHYEKILIERADLNYDIDGVVYKVDDLRLQKRLGFTSTAPRWAIAHKFPSETAVTQILNIEIQVGRTGSLSPVARLKPINVGGVMVSNATLHNEDYILGLDGEGTKIRNGVDIRIGDWVEVYRAGDVIPKVSSVILDKRPSEAKKYIFPKVCPKCGSKAERGDKDSVIRCSGGISCPSQAIEKLKHFVSKKAFNINGLGSKVVEEFYCAGLIKWPRDIFLLREKCSDTGNFPLGKREGWGATSSEKLFNAIEEAREIDLNRFIYALGIRHVGEQASLLLAKNYFSWDRFYTSMSKLRHKDESDWYNLCAIDGIGEIVANALSNYFQSKESELVLEPLLNFLNIRDFAQIALRQSPITDLNVVFTGALHQTTRIEAKAKAESLGARVSTTISKNTDILVTGQKTGTKLQKALDLNIKIVSEDEWHKLIDGLN